MKCSGMSLLVAPATPRIDGDSFRASCDETADSAVPDPHTVATQDLIMVRTPGFGRWMVIGQGLIPGPARRIAGVRAATCEKVAGPAEVSSAETLDTPLRAIYAPGTFEIQ